ncbi:MAG: hypothetical protein NUW00_05095 [Candidatus Kaiserbacteria bacterium]|nr:hypothetical protein [Candidatus Kaiserbacteria bacterium]
MVFLHSGLAVMARPQEFLEEKMELESVRLIVGSFIHIGVFVEEVSRSIICDGPYKLETVCLRVVNMDGLTFTTQDLERMSLPSDDCGAQEIGGLCDRKRERIFLEYFSRGMPAHQGRFLLLCAKVEGSGAVRVTFTITCHSSSGE